MTLTDALAPFNGKYSAAFLRAMDFVLPSEADFQSGHYDDWDYVSTEHDPSDPGGTTRYGIDQRSHPGVDIENLTLASALEIYFKGEWAMIRGDDIPGDLALAVMDSAVNVGSSRAIKWLQSACGLQGSNVDGVIGDQTLAAVRNTGDAAIDSLLAAREAYYRDLPPRLTTRYLKGWLARVENLRQLLAQSPDAVAVT